MSSRALLLYVSAYRPVMERTVLIASLLGIVVNMHAGLQLTVGFPNGCLGLNLVPGDLASCSRAIHGGMPFVTGLPSLEVMTGLLAIVALVSILFFVVSYLAPRYSRWVALARLILLAGAGGLTTYYLVAASDGPGGSGAIAVLTGVSLGLSLAFVVASTFVSPRTRSALMASSSFTPRTFRREAVLVLYLVALTIVLVGADYAAYDALSANNGAPGVDRTASVTTSIAAPAVRASDSGPAVCGYDESRSTVQQYKTLVGMDDPTVGAENADAVTVVEFFDPNCPHCATFHTVMKRLIDEYGDRVRFVFKPIPLGQKSVNQIEALYAAHRAGSFLKMLNAQYERQSPAGLSTDQLVDIAESIGMDEQTLQSAIEEDRHMGAIRLVYQQAQRVGVDSTPTVMINGRFVRADSRTVECMGSLIESAAG
ncbi:thioredoxin domain-containing protein [Longibacter sp.]|uniref:thioredoxin domain-containing protein n=1 Tax=Longibacter sp. TaxID=2045415 RepID=UPI003EC0C1E9